MKMYVVVKHRPDVDGMGDPDVDPVFMTWDDEEARTCVDAINKVQNAIVSSIVTLEPGQTMWW